MERHQGDAPLKEWANARLHTPDLRSLRHVRLDRQRGVVSCEGRDFTPAELEGAYPGYVLEITSGFPRAGMDAGFRGPTLYNDDPWHPAHSPVERVLSSYWSAFWLTVFAAYWLEGQGVTPWDWILPDGSPFIVRWLVGVGMVALAARPVNRWLAGIVDRWVVERIQRYMYRRRALTCGCGDEQGASPGA